MARRRYYGSRNDKPIISKVLVFFTFILLVAVIFSLLADIYWAFDLFSHFTSYYIIISAVLSLLLLPYRRIVWLSISLGILLFEVFKLVPYVNLQDEMQGKYDEVKVLQYNVRRSNNNVEEMTKWIISQSEDVDIVVLLEVTGSWDEALRRIKWAYPYHITEDMRGGRNMVIFSRLYIDEFEIKNLGETNASALVLRGETTGYEIPFVLYGIHPPPPVLPSYTKRRNDILKSVAENIAKEDISHKFIVADFNTTKFSPAFKKLAEVSGLHDSNEGLGLDAFNTTWPSFMPNYFGIAIDNMLVSNNFVVEKKEVGPSMGSDHYPVITTLKFMVDEKNNAQE